MSQPIHHPKGILLTTGAALEEIFFNALLDRMTGRPEGAAAYEVVAKRHPDYTTAAFWCHLLTVAKRQVLWGDNAAALATLNEGLEEPDRFSAQSEAMILEAIKPYLPMMWAHEASALTTLLGG